MKKFGQYMNGDKFTTSPGLITTEECGNKNILLNEKVAYWSICRQDYPHQDDFDEITLNPTKQGHHHRKDLVTICNHINRKETSIYDKPPKEFLKALKSLVKGDFDNSSETSHSKDSNITRPAIPIGPSFQAEVPKWVGIANERQYNSDDFKWLGIQIWPMPGISKNNTKGIGEGRHDTCSCEFPGSFDCVKLHTSEARELLKLEIGNTFSSWNFDEMGEDVSKSWTLKEQKEFESLVKFNSLSNGTNFWKLAMDLFPSKSMKCMVNYYHNVYIPRRLSMKTRYSFDVVDSGNDQDENLNNKNDYSSTEAIIEGDLIGGLQNVAHTLIENLLLRKLYCSTFYD